MTSYFVFFSSQSGKDLKPKAIPLFLGDVELLSLRIFVKAPDVLFLTPKDGHFNKAIHENTDVNIEKGQY